MIFSVHAPLVLTQYAQGAGVPEDSILAYAWVNLAGANGYDVSDLKAINEGSLSQEEISKAQEPAMKVMKYYPDACQPNGKPWLCPLSLWWRSYKRLKSVSAYAWQKQEITSYTLGVQD